MSLTGSSPLTDPSTSRLSLGEFADPAIFRAVWKKSLRGSLRTMRFADLNLAPDPLDYVAFEWDLNRAIDGLCEEIAEGTYLPRPPEIVRGAKSVGLTRPLAFPVPRDQLTYRVLTIRACHGRIFRR